MQSTLVCGSKWQCSGEHLTKGCRWRSGGRRLGHRFGRRDQRLGSRFLGRRSRFLLRMKGIWLKYSEQLVDCRKRNDYGFICLRFNDERSIDATALPVPWMTFKLMLLTMAPMASAASLPTVVMVATASQVKPPTA